MDILSSFQNTIRRHPNDAALVYQSRTFTYRELDTLSDRIAAFLTRHGAGGKAVGVVMHRKPEWIATILGIWKSGGIYVPLDMGNPEERLENILTDCTVALVLRHETGFLPHGIPAYTVEEALREETAATRIRPETDATACIIYTSGTSGLPKGVPMRHRQLAALSALCMEHLFYVHPGERILQLAGLNFSASLVEILTGLLNGICLVMATEEEKHRPDLLAELINREQVASAILPPALLSAMPPFPLPGLKTLVVAGECVTEEAKDRWRQGRRMVNGYGFTENTVLVTSGVYDNDTPANDIGTPVPDTRIYVLDASLSPVPDGTPGELCVSGERLSEGYWNRPDQNAGKFIENPFATEHDRQKECGLLLYRSGDQVVRQKNGRYLYLGRLDEQIELRGIRIEPGEIERCLNRYPDITASAVLLKQRNNKPILVAYLQTGQEIDRKEIASFAAEHLPEYMCPAHYVTLRQFPMTLNRKTDKKRLPEPDWSLSREDNLPQTPTEKAVAAIWSKILRTSPIGRHERFLSLGGDSLSIVLMTDLLEKKFGITLKAGEIFARPDLASLAAFIDRSVAALPATSGNLPSGTGAVYDLPPSLANLLNECQSSESMNEGYKLAIFLPFGNGLQVEPLRKAWTRIVREQEALRLCFPDGQCTVSPADTIPQLQAVETQDFLQDAYRLYQKPLTPGSFPLYHTCLYHLPDGNYRLTVILHHLIADGWSLRLLHRMLSEYYEQELTGHITPAPVCSYREYTIRSREQPALEEKRKFWQAYLSGYEDLELSVKIAPQKQEQKQGGAVSFPMEKKAAEALHGFCKTHAVTSLAVCLAVYQLLLAKYSGQTGFIVGMAVTDRRKSEFRNLIGYLTTLLPVRMPLAPTDFISTVRRLSGDIMVLLDNTLPLDMVGECAGQTGKRMIRFAFGLEEVTTPLSVPDEWTQFSPFDLSLIIHRYGGRYSYHYQYATGSFDAAFLLQFSQSFNTALRYLTAYPERNTDTCPLLPQEVIRHITSAFRLSSFRLSSFRLPRKNIVACFEETACHCPEREAYCWNGIRFSYGKLKEMSDHVAAFLGNRPALHGKEQPVSIGLCLKEKRFLPAGILGILKSGGCYVPLDSQLPARRLQFIVDDAAISLILSDTVRTVDRCGCLSMEEALVYPVSAESRPYPIRPDNPAYIIYTSGTTGQPKGIPVTHAASLLFAENQARVFKLRPDMRMLQYAGAGFDASILEMFPAWYCGASLVIPTEEERRDGKRLLHLMEREKVGCALIPPALLSRLPYRKLPSLETLAVGGESTPLETMRRWSMGRRLINAYGPTENTVVTTCAEFSPDGPANDIGVPLPGVSCYVVNKDMNLMPDGVPGELCIGGLQLTEGYIRREALNRILFTDNPFVLPEDAEKKVNTRIYHSGDKVVRTPEGHFLYLGRMDSQVKLRGFRIETEEIARRLEEVPSVSQALVVLQATGKGLPYLAAYVVTDKKNEVRTEILRAHLSDCLPSYMIPSAWCILERMPMTLNGKIDRQALPEAVRPADDDYEQPAGQEERMLADMVQRMLGTERLGVTADLFDLGMTSLQAMILVADAQKKGIRLSVTDVYRGRCIRHILARHSGACHYWEGNPANTDKPVMVLVCGYPPCRPFYERFIRRFKNDYLFLVFDSFLDFFSRYPDYPKERLTDTYYETLLQESADRKIAVVAGHCLGGELAMLLAERLRTSRQPDVKVLAIDSFILRDRDLLIPREEQDGPFPERRKTANEIIRRMPRPVFGGGMIAGIAIRPSEQFLYEAGKTDDAGLRMKMREMSKRNLSDWRRLCPHAVLVEMDCDHWNVFDRQPLEQLYQAVRQHWNTRH